MYQSKVQKTLAILNTQTKNCKQEKMVIKGVKQVYRCRKLTFPSGEKMTFRNHLLLLSYQYQQQHKPATMMDRRRRHG